MKLVDILAIRLKEWPHNAEVLVQGHDGLIFPPGCGIPTTNVTQTELAEDWELAEVTRKEWLAAVKAKTEAPQNDESQNVARIEWSGEGLPPIGVACQVTPHNDVWGFSTLETRPCSVIAYHADFAWIDLGGPGVPLATRIDKVDFTPIRTPEQIATDQREKGISELLSVALAADPNSQDVCAAIYDAGYRKP